MPSFAQNFDDMSSQPPDYGQPSQYPPHRGLEGTIRPGLSTPYSDNQTVHHAQRIPHHQFNQDPRNSIRNPSPNLPSLRHMTSDRSNSEMENSYGIPMPYPDGHGYSYPAECESEQNHYSSRRMPIYESVHRGHQSYSESNASGSSYLPNQTRFLSNCDAAQGYTPMRSSYAESDYSPHSPHPMNGAPYSTFGVGGDSGDSRGKKRRGNLPKPVTDILRSWFHEHLDHPYPSEDDKQMLIARTGLSISQVP